MIVSSHRLRSCKGSAALVAMDEVVFIKNALKNQGEV